MLPAVFYSLFYFKIVGVILLWFILILQFLFFTMKTIMDIAIVHISGTRWDISIHTHSVYSMMKSNRLYPSLSLSPVVTSLLGGHCSQILPMRASLSLVSGLLHLVSPVLLQRTGLCFSLWLNSSPYCVYTTFSLCYWWMPIRGALPHCSQIGKIPYSCISWKHFLNWDAFFADDSSVFWVDA